MLLADFAGWLDAVSATLILFFLLSPLKSPSEESVPLRRRRFSRGVAACPACRVVSQVEGSRKVRECRNSGYATEELPCRTAI